MTLRVLIVDDQRGLRRSLALLLENAGMSVTEAGSGREALEKMAQTPADVVVTDLRMEGMSGNDLLRELKCRHAQTPVILITAYGSIETAVEAMRLGAFDYLTKPFAEQEIVEKIHQAYAVASSAAARRGPAHADDLIAESPAMQAVMIRADRIAAVDLSILITGETGTGKSRLARYIHERSQRARGPFVALNCASVPEQLLESELFGHTKGSFTGATENRQGLFEAADGGTIFLDEIDTLSLAMQAKLLSVLQEHEIRRIGATRARKIDIRVISAANRDLSSLIETGDFRHDLFYRVNGYRIHLPPLRERGHDLEVLLEALITHFAAKHERGRMFVTSAARTRVLTYDFPGNIRQLESVAEQMVIFADGSGCIDVNSLPEELLGNAARVVSGPTETISPSLADTERQAIEWALDAHDNLSDAARSLGIGRTTLWRKLRQYDIRRPHRVLRR